MRATTAAVLTSLMLIACGKDEGPKPKPTPPKAEPAAPDKTPAKAADAATEAPADRQAKLTAEYERYQDHLVTHAADGLSDADKAVLEHLLAAAKLIEELHMLQLDPQSLTWRDEIAKSGTEIEKQIFFRYQSPWCGDDTSPECCALAECPPKKIGQVHWPADLTDAELEALAKQTNGAALRSPFTFVERKKEEGGGFTAVPYAKTELLGPRMKQVAAELRAASEASTHPSLKKFLASRAAAFEDVESPYPYDASDYDWIALDGDWEVTVGPYETYKNPHQLKALFQMYIGREDKKLSGELKRFKDNLQAMENALSELVGKDIYQSRKLDPRISIRAVEVWMAAGDGRRDRGVIAAFHLPNRGKSVDEGLYKKVMLVNHSEAFKPVMKARAAVILDPEQAQWVDLRSDITNVAFHEFAHGFGAYHEMKVKTPSGEEMTIKAALKEHDALLEEEKADTFGLWLLQFQKTQGWVDDAEVKRRYVSAVMHSLGLLQYALPGTYPRMTAIEIGWWTDHGGVIWNAETGRFKVDFEKMPAAVESLAKEVATIQLTGDYARAQRLIGRYITKTGEKSYELKGTVAEARAVMVKKFKEAGITSPSLRYEVTGL